MPAAGDGARVEEVEVRAYRIPTDAPESDGTLQWDATVLVAVHVRAGGVRGFGYSYADRATGEVVRDLLAPRVKGRDVLDLPAIHTEMRRAVRNLGGRGIAAMAISAVDAALWDAKGKVLGVPLVRLLGAVRDGIPGYGSGGFTSYPVERLQEQLGGWVEQGFRMVKLKIGRDPAADLARVAAVREAVGAGPEIFVDANGAYERKEALAKAAAFAPLGVTYFEEPVSMDDLEGLRLLRDRAPGPVRIAAGEYGYTPWDFHRLVQAGAVDVLQADGTRCGGPTGFLLASAIADGWGLPLSAHCAPSLHAPLMCAAPRGVHLEWFHDHVRIERMLFDGAPRAEKGIVRPDLSRPGLGVELKEADAERYAV